MQGETKKDHNRDCTCGTHTEHLCYLQYEGFHYAHRAEYKALVQDAQFICQGCGRTAKRSDSLCMPREL
ncbi:MAG: hypothetical protein FJ221_00090 [Lentisphaerae bacterium]|nr:hypothetical protein [Lentisphaerota bacterium]